MKYLKYFNSTEVAKYIINKTLNQIIKNLIFLGIIIFMISRFTLSYRL